MPKLENLAKLLDVYGCDLVDLQMELDGPERSRWRALELGREIANDYVDALEAQGFVVATRRDGMGKTVQVLWKGGTE